MARLPTTSLRFSRMLQLTPSVSIWWSNVCACSSPVWKNFFSVLKKRPQISAWRRTRLPLVRYSLCVPCADVRQSLTRDVVSSRKCLGMIALRNGHALFTLAPRASTAFIMYSICCR